MAGNGQNADENKFSFENNGNLIRKDYFFRRTYFLLDDNETFVETVAIAEESKVMQGKRIRFSCEVLESNSRELKLQDFPQDFVNKLKNEEVIKEVVNIDKEKLKEILDTYRDNLFQFQYTN